MEEGQKEEQHASGSCQQEAADGKEGGQVKRKARCKDQKICHVCGDRALGYNFNAMTCESCKAFFRRNALKQLAGTCMFQGNCKIDVRTRRFCPSCRLAKCLSIGMKKEMILDETERKARMQKVMENREKRKGKDATGKDEDTFYMKEEPLSDTETVPDQSGYSSSEGTNLADTFSQCSPQFTSEVPVIPSREGPKDPAMYRTLSAAEENLFEELRVSYSMTIGEPVVGKELDESDYLSANDLVNHSEVAVRRLIKFIKRMEDFQQLCQEDQIAALKACVMNSLLLRSVCFYSVEQDAWITPKGSISTSILKKTTGYGDLHDSHTKYCRTLKQIVNNDNCMFALLQVIVIFNPDGKNLRGRSLISDIQDKYMLMLKHYLEAEFSFETARQYFAILIQKLAELKGLSDSHGRVLLQVNPMKIEPLMLEVLNLH